MIHESFSHFVTKFFDLFEISFGNSVSFGNSISFGNSVSFRNFISFTELFSNSFFSSLSKYFSFYFFIKLFIKTEPFLWKIQTQSGFNHLKMLLFIRIALIKTNWTLLNINITFTHVWREFSLYFSHHWHHQSHHWLIASEYFDRLLKNLLVLLVVIIKSSASIKVVMVWHQWIIRCIKMPWNALNFNKFTFSFCWIWHPNFGKLWTQNNDRSIFHPLHETILPSPAPFIMCIDSVNDVREKISSNLTVYGRIDSIPKRFPIYFWSTTVGWRK